MVTLVLVLTLVNLVLLGASICLIVRSRRRLRERVEEEHRAQEVLYEASVEYGQVVALYPEANRRHHAVSHGSSADLLAIPPQAQ